jgi:hypothetical protein
MPGRQPQVGDSVHYVSHGTPVRADGSQAFESQCRAAIVTEVYYEDGEPTMRVNLTVLNPTGMFFSQAVPFSDSRGITFEGDPGSSVKREGGTWHWKGHE